MSKPYQLAVFLVLFLGFHVISFAGVSADKNLVPIVSLLLGNEVNILFFAGGDGTPENPYQVETAEQLNMVREHLDKHFIQIADIDMGSSPWNTDAGWEPLGNDSTQFTGVFNGSGKIVTGLTINRPEANYQGLFGYISSGGEVKNLGLENVNVKGNSCVGGLAGANANSTISDSYSSGIIEGSGSDIGGLVGCNSTGGIIQNSSSDAAVSGGQIAGGLVGGNFGFISNSFSTGSVTGTYVIGGLSGLTAWDDNGISNCYSTASVTGINAVGGLAGENNYGNISYSYSTGPVTATDTGSSSGGLVSLSTFGTITSSYWDIETSGQLYSAGGTGKTTEEMQELLTYSDWDFANVWGINPDENSGYPFLRWQGYTHVPYFAGGDGSPEDPYQVETAGQLNNVRYFLDKHFIQTADIDLSIYADWQPVGDETDMFIGHYNGGQKQISNLTITLAGESYPFEIEAGLFGVSEGEIENVVLADVMVNGHTRTGSLVGQNQSGGTITNCSASGTVTGVTYVGGLAGDNFGSITGSSADIAATAYNRLGGLVGFNETGGVISRCWSKGTVSGTGVYQEMMGGLIGYNNGLVEKSFSAANISATYLSTGGLVGYNFTGVISNCYATGSVSGGSRVGGLVADNRNEVNNSYSIGVVSGTSNLGGLAGISTNGVGGDIILTTAYYDMDTSGMNDTGKGEPRTTAQMKQQATFAGWDFDSIWGIDPTINNGYPYFR